MKAVHSTAKNCHTDEIKMKTVTFVALCLDHPVDPALVNSLTKTRCIAASECFISAFL